MGNVRLWIWPGVVAVACLSALALWFETGSIEADLKARTLSALRQDHAWVQVQVNGRDIKLTGLAPDEASQLAVVSAAGNIPGASDIKDATALLPEEKPYRLSVKKTSDGITFNGFVPSEAARAKIVAALTGLLPGIALTDNMKLARGAPAELVALAGHGLSAFPRLVTGSLEITDRTMRVSGEALNPDDHEMVLDVLSSVPASAGVLGDVDITPAALTGDYLWSAAKDAGTLVVDGYAPDSQVRSKILVRAAATADGRNVEDRMRFAKGVPAGLDLLVVAETGLAVLERMTAGTVTLSNRSLSVSGDARDAESFRRIQELLPARLAGGAVLGTADIGMTQSAGAGGELAARFVDDKLELSGSVSSEAARTSLIETAGLKFGPGNISDELKISQQAVASDEEAALVALQALSRLEGGEARIQGGVVSIRGTALSRPGSEEIEQLLKEGLPQGYAGRAEIAAAAKTASNLSAKSCQTELDRLLSANTVRFPTGEATIQTHSHGFLDRIASVAQRCSQTRLEISGHTDADGSEADNLVLSERRAGAVRDYLATAGVDRNRLVAIGFGEARPLRSGDTAEDKAANRRIEFKVLD